MSSPAPSMLQLRDIHLPASPELWPPAPGWWLLALALIIAAAWLGTRLWRKLRLRRQQRRILALLEQAERVSGDTPTPEFLATLSGLMRRLALARYPRGEIASLTGLDWLRFLDRAGGDGQFADGPGRVLAEGPYLRTLPDGVDRQQLSSLVRQWILRNTGA